MAPRPSPVRLNPTPATTSAAAWSGLAIASFVTGVCCVHLAAIICGHLALGRMKREPQLKGRWMAVVGLVLGYLSLTLSMAAAGLILLGAIKASEQAAQVPPGNIPFVNRPGTNTVPDRPADVDLRGTNRAVSTSSVKGTLQGQGFRVEQVAVRGDRVDLSIVTDTGRKDQINLFLFLKENPERENLRVKVPDPNRRMMPHVHVPNLTGPGRTILSSDYELELEFKSVSEGGLPGTLRFSAQKPFPVEFSGSFVAALR